jgi:putative addiction module component (TIGR02574 family)
MSEIRSSRRFQRLAPPFVLLETETMSESAIDYRKLSVPERIRLVEDIWCSIAADTPGVAVPQAVLEEAERRHAEHRQDPGSGIRGEQVRAEMYERGE